MTTFKISYTDNTSETIKARNYLDIETGGWIEFRDANHVQLLRVRGVEVARIEVVTS